MEYFYLFFSYSKAYICTLQYYFSVKEAKAQILDFLTYIIYDIFYFFKRSERAVMMYQNSMSVLLFESTVQLATLNICLLVRRLC
jgi:hypothetical protein